MEEQRAWWKECVVYQIYPRSFQDSNGDGIGDLNGIRSRLDYLKDLGIDVIWLSPVYQSPGDDNGYDISDYKAVMDVFGTMEDFDCLLAEIHHRGMKLVMDLVVNHTSDEHAWFAESRRSRDNPYRDYYIWKEPVNEGPPNNWASRFRGPAWEYDGRTGMYYLHIYSKKQPDLNWENPRVRQEIYEMMTWWGNKGIDGFRMDVISMLSKDQRFPDGVLKEGNPYGDGLPYYANGPRIHAYLQEMNREVLSRFDWMTVGEGVGVGTREAVQYAGYESHELNMMFHFEHVELNPGPFGKWNDNPVCLRDLKKVLSRWQTELEGKAWNSLFWENHDYPRAVSRFGNDSPGFWELSAKMLAVCLYMMKGTPYIYQGQELGMTNFQGSSLEDFQDIEIHNLCNFFDQPGIITKNQNLMMSKASQIVHKLPCIIHLDIVIRAAIGLGIFRTDYFSFLNAHGITCRIETTKCNIIVFVLCKINLKLTAEALSGKCPQLVFQRFCSVSVHTKGRNCMMDPEQLICLMIWISHKGRTVCSVLHDQHCHKCIQVFLASTWNSLILHN